MIVWLGLLLAVNLCSAADNMNVANLLFSASLQALMTEGNQPSQVSPGQETPHIVLKPVAHEPKKYKVEKLSIPDMKHKVHHQHKPRGKN